MRYKLSPAYKLFWLLVLCPFFLMSCTSAKDRSIRLDDRCIIIPKKFFRSSNLAFSFFGTDTSVEEMSLKFPAKHLAENITGYSSQYDGSGTKVTADLRVLVHILDTENVEYIQSGVHYADLWAGTGGYSNEQLGQKVEWDEHVGLFRVYHRDISRMWKFTNVAPNQNSDDGQPVERVVAGCRLRSRDDQNTYTCLHSSLLNNIQFEYWIADTNFHLHKEIDQFIFDQMDSWKTKC